MRRWLIGLGISVLLGGIAVFRRVRRQEQDQADAFIGRFILALEKHAVDHIENLADITDPYAWNDDFVGIINGKTFRFQMQAPIGPNRMPVPGSMRRYALLWGDEVVKATESPDADDDPYALKRVHKMLLQAYRKNKGIRPS